MGSFNSAVRKATMWLFQLLCLPWVLTLAAGCPCSFDIALGEVICDAGSQDILPFSLPACLPGVQNNQVQRLILADQNFPDVTIDSFSLFKNLQYLDLSYSNIARIDEFVFDENFELKKIDLKGNELVSVPALFQYPGSALQSLSLRHNRIEAVNSRNLDNLVFLDLDDNLMTDDALTETLALLPNVYELSLQSNLIVRIDKTMFSNQKNIEVINLWNNQISSIDSGSFDHMLNIKSIDLKSNALTEYQTESWHFCQSLKMETLEVRLEDGKKVTQDLKVDEHTQIFCEQAERTGPTISTSCSNDNGHLSCSGNIEDLLCELREMDFKSITFIYHKDEDEVTVSNFFEAETNSYFQNMNQVNGKSDLTRFLSELRLYGTKFDLATLDDHLGLRTEKVTIFADTVYMTRPLERPINSTIHIRARVVSISEDILMNMTRKQFFEPLQADQVVDNWAPVQEIISEVGNVTFSVNKLGFIEIQKELITIPGYTSSKGCSPRIFSVEEYESEHNTPPSVFFDRVQLSLLRMAVRTLATTRSNNVLAIEMADHALLKTTNRTIVKDTKAYLLTQKIFHDKEVITSHKLSIPFYETPVISRLASIMFDQMSLYASNETLLMLKLDNALTSMREMNHNFEGAKLMRELYFERELETLEEIWNSTDNSWKWSFNASRDMEQNIQDSIQKNEEEMMNMEENELKEMLERAKDTVESDQAVVDEFIAEIDRYSKEAQLSLDFQRTKLDETNKAGTDIQAEKEKFDASIEKWKEEQLRKAFFGFLTAIFGVIVGIATMQPEIAGAGIAAGVAEAGAAGAEIADVMASIEELIQALADLDKMLDAISGVGDIDVSIPDLGSDLAMDTAINWRGALENAYSMKNMTSKFHDMEILGQTKIASVGPATENGVDPAGLQQAMSTYNDRGSQLVQETANFAQLMMHLADLAGELQVAELDLEIAIEQVERVKKMLEDLQKQHEEYVEWMNQHRDEYQNKTDEFAAAYANSSTADKEAFKEQIIFLFEKFELAFEDSNNKYIAMMNDLTGALFEKVASVKQHSMVQRSMVMNLYQDYCDGLFYFSFTECYKDNPTEQYVPTMSDDFQSFLFKLKNIEWDSITNMESLPNLPSPFSDVSIVLMDKHIAGFNSSSQMFGAATSLRNDGEAYFNFKHHNEYLDDFYRVRINSVTVHLLDTNGNTFQSPRDEIIRFLVYMPVEFNDKDLNGNEFAFRGLKHFCPADYFINEEGHIQHISSCEVDHEFDGVNHKTSHDGLFKVVAKNIRQDILDLIGGIKVTLGGSYSPNERNLPDPTTIGEDYETIH